jgi:acid phosphatase class B
MHTELNDLMAYFSKRTGSALSSLEYDIGSQLLSPLARNFKKLNKWWRKSNRGASEPRIPEAQGQQAVNVIKGVNR